VDTWLVGIEESIELCGSVTNTHLFILRYCCANLILALVVFIFTFGLTVYRIEQAPDLFTDEIIYTRVGIRTAARVLWFGIAARPS